MSLLPQTFIINTTSDLKTNAEEDKKIKDASSEIPMRGVNLRSGPQCHPPGKETVARLLFASTIISSLERKSLVYDEINKGGDVLRLT
jgi:hypothetical protein